MVTVTFEHTDDKIVSVSFGPFHWVELNNDALRIADTGEQIAVIEPDHNWYIIGIGSEYVPYRDTPYNHVVIRST